MKFFIIAVLAISAFPVLAQDPTKVAPEAYKLQFENDWVRVLRVHYAARKRVPVHDHSRFPAAYVYLNDAGPLNFFHTGDDKPLTRQAVKARMLRLSKTSAAQETHSVDNFSNTDSDFVRIELKTLHQGESLTYARYPAENYDRKKEFSKVHFDTSDLSVTRLAAPAGNELKIGAQRYPVLIVLATAAKVDGREASAGDTFWLKTGEMTKIAALANGEAEVIRFDIKVAPGTLN